MFTSDFPSLISLGECLSLVSVECCVLIYSSTLPNLSPFPCSSSLSVLLCPPRLLVDFMTQSLIYGDVVSCPVSMAGLDPNDQQDASIDGDMIYGVVLGQGLKKGAHSKRVIWTNKATTEVPTRTLAHVTDPALHTFIYQQVIPFLPHPKSLLTPASKCKCHAITGTARQ